jgi:hypothetical protein
MARWVRTKKLTEHTGIPERTYEKWRVVGGGPPFAKLRGVVLYDLDAFDRWASSLTRRSTREPAGDAR